MSFTYKIVEKTCFFLNKHANELIKERMYRHLPQLNKSEDIQE